MDAVDGYLARKFGQASQLGAVLDIMGDSYDLSDKNEIHTYYLRYHA
jgi:hypothetical protein